MRTLLGDEPGEGGIQGTEPDRPNPNGDAPLPHETPSLDDLEPSPARPSPPDVAAAAPTSDGSRQRKLPSIAPDPEPGHRRSRFDGEAGTVLYNDQHADFLLVKDDEPALFDYLATLVAKEYVVYNNPRADSDELAEELVRMLIRVRRHLPGRIRRRS
jgi:hypothetical protein